MAEPPPPIESEEPPPDLDGPPRSPIRREKSSTVGTEQTHQLRTVMQAHQARDLHDEEVLEVCAQLREAVALREKYRQRVETQLNHSSDDVEPATPGCRGIDPFTPPILPPRTFGFESTRGVFVAWEETETGREYFGQAPSFNAFMRDMLRLLQICSDAAVNSFCYRRLQKLEARFKLHVMEHEASEAAEQRAVPHRDFYNCRKVWGALALCAAAATPPPTRPPPPAPTRWTRTCTSRLP